MLTELLRYARHDTKNSTHVISFKSQKYLLRIKIFLSEVLLYVSLVLSALQTYHKNPNKRGCENYFYFNNEEAEDQKIRGHKFTRMKI